MNKVIIRYFFIDNLFILYMFVYIDINDSFRVFRLLNNFIIYIFFQLNFLYL